MENNIVQQILHLIESGSVEHRCASLLVLGALKLESPGIIKTVGAALESPNPVIRDYALRYLEEAQPKAGVPVLLRFLDDPDKEIEQRAVRLLGRCGQAAVDAVLKHVPSASRSWQLNAARVLCAARGKTAWKGLLRMLVSGGDEFNKTVCDLMTPAMRELDPKDQPMLYDEIESLAKTLDVREQRPAVVSAARLFGQLGRPQARRWLFRFVGPEHPAILRSHALVALLRCLRDEDIKKDEYAKLFPLLEEAEFSEVARLALEILDQHPLPEDCRPVLSRLLGSPHGSVQKFALRKMGDFGSPATVRMLVQQLGDPDYRRRDIAAHSLHKIPEARAALIKELVACDNPSKAWTIAELLPSYEGKWRQDTLETLWKRLQAAIAAQDRIQNSFIHVLKSAGADYTYEQLATHAARLIKAKKYKEAVGFLAPLKEFSEFKAEDKFRLALAQLKLHPPTVGDRRQDSALDLLCEIYRGSAYPVLEALRKEKSLTADDLFYLGFRLTERAGEERALGKGLLEHLAARLPRNKVGKNAKNKLKLIGNMAT
jgi:HEAT repeat protein